MRDKAVSLIKSSAEIGTQAWRSNLSGCEGLKYRVRLLASSKKEIGRVGKALV